MKDIRETTSIAAQKAHGTWLGLFLKNSNLFATIEIDGELWLIGNIDNATTYQLYSATRGKLQGNGWNPAQSLIPVDEANEIGVSLSAPPCAA